MINYIRKKFIDFFVSKDHKHLPSSGLIPHNDPSLMFVNSGMVQFKDCFLGAQAPQYKNVVTAQKCVRAGGKHNDLENVGHTKRHHTFFEMLGNFSFGGYFKEEAIKMAWEFLTKELNLDPNRLFITVYHDDDEAFGIWHSITGFDKNRIIRIETEDNFWQMGSTGPCGPCSEIFYDHGEHLQGELPANNADTGERYVEIWNLVFMQYVKNEDGSLHKIAQPCIDTGMGLERITAVLEKTDDNYEIGLFKELINQSKSLTPKHSNIFAHRAIADHARSTAFLIADGVTPSNTSSGYVLRRIIRRATRYAKMLDINTPVLGILFQTLEHLMGDYYSELTRHRELIIQTLLSEEESFRLTLTTGMHLLEDTIKNMKSGEKLSGDIAFMLYDRHGFPLDLTIDILKEHNIEVDEEGFTERMSQQKELARASWIGQDFKEQDSKTMNLAKKYGKTAFIGYDHHTCTAKILEVYENSNNKLTVITDTTIFYPESGGQECDIGVVSNSKCIFQVERVNKLGGGIIIHEGYITKGNIDELTGNVIMQIDIKRRDMSARNHSATHLLHYALRQRLGKHVSQKGSLVSQEKLRFDFSHHSNLSQDDLYSIEDTVNSMIWRNSPTIIEEKSLEDAVNGGALAFFGEKYEENVRVVNIGESSELCGGTHVKNTSDIGVLTITSESSIARGVRRIEAVTHMAAFKHFRERREKHLQLEHDLEERLKLTQKHYQKEITSIYQSIIDGSANQIIECEHISIAIKKVENVPQHILKTFTTGLRSIASLVLVSSTYNEEYFMMIVLSKILAQEQNLISSLKLIIENSGGKTQPSAPYIIQSVFKTEKQMDQSITSIISISRDYL